MKKCIAMLVVGENHKKLFKVNKACWKKYADRIGADFVLLEFTEGTLPYHPAWAKLPGIYQLLEIYDRVMYVDGDTVIDADAAPDIFEVVKEDEFGAFYEGFHDERYLRSLLPALNMYQIKTDRKYDGEYFNSGVMVVSKMHRDLFILPDIKECNFYEQGCLNARVFGYNVKVKNLSYKWNRMSLVDHVCGEDLHGSYIVHWAGSNDYDKIAEQMQDVLEKFKDRANAKTRFYVCVGGGLGDAATCEPIFRYAIENVYKNDPNVEFHIFTYPEYEIVLRGLKRYKNVFFYKREEDMPQETLFAGLKIQVPRREAYTHPHSGQHAVRLFFPYSDVHNQDYGSLCMLMQTIHPRWARQPIIPVEDQDREELREIIAAQTGDCVKSFSFKWPGLASCVVHPGVGWPSKTFPVEYWQEIIEKISEFATVIIIGKEKVLPVKLPSNGNGIDLRNKTKLEHNLALISQATLTLSNDSSPIHMAAAYDNYICMIATCKRPELVMPYRKGTQDYKALAVYHWLTCEDLERRPTDLMLQSLAEVNGKIEDYLPSVDFVVKHVERMIIMNPIMIDQKTGWEQERPR